MYCLRKLNIMPRSSGNAFYKSTIIMVGSIKLDFSSGKLVTAWNGASDSLPGQLRAQLFPQGGGRLPLTYACTNNHPKLPAVRQEY